MLRETVENNLGQVLRNYRRDPRRRVSLRDLGSEVDMSYVAIWRREQPPSHPDHVRMSNSELLELCAAIERIVERRAAELSPADVL